MKIIETKIQKRFADIDMFRHVNNIHQQAYFDLGKTDYYHSVLSLDALIHNPTLVIVSVKSDFLAQVRYEDDIVVRSWVDRVGDKSITLRQQIVALGSGRNADGDIAAAHASQPPGAAVPGEVVCTESTSVLVCFDLPTQRAIPVPAAWRAAVGL
jgi:acyl-CoA thioester hydrolase